MWGVVRGYMRGTDWECRAEDIVWEHCAEQPTALGCSLPQNSLLSVWRGNSYLYMFIFIALLMMQWGAKDAINISYWQHYSTNQEHIDNVRGCTQ